MTRVRATGVLADVDALRRAVGGRLRDGGRFAGLFATGPLEQPGGGRRRAVDPVTLSVAVADDGRVDLYEAMVVGNYPSLTNDVPAAFWYERALHDRFGVVPEGHPRLDPLVLPLPHQRVQAGVIPRHVHGAGLFTIPHGPVRSGVMESVEFLVETPGEDISHLHVRIFAKHRGVERSFQGRTTADAALLAERVEGVSTVAHALAYAHAVERLANIELPRAAAYVRVLHAELERIANHLDAAVRLAEAAGLAVAIARFSAHKEQIMRIRGRLCGSRFGRGVVVPGGVRTLPVLGADLAAELESLESAVCADATVLMRTSSFLDRIRGTGPLEPSTAREYGALGPVGRGSGLYDDARVTRPYDAYPDLTMWQSPEISAGDARARTAVRWHEVGESFDLIRQVLHRLDGVPRETAVRGEMPSVTGRGVGWAEAAQGEVMYVVDVTDGRITRCWPRSASFHNLSLFHLVFAGDVFTDFPFIEASFGLSVAGAVL